MVALRRAIACAALLLGTASLALPVTAKDEDIVRLQLNGVIDQVNAAYIETGIQSAMDSGAVAVLLEIDSPGGELTSMKRILQAILGSQVPVITYVTPQGAQAASAATFITLAGDVAAMAPSTTIGAASVVGSGGEDLPDTLAEKVNNSNAAIIRDLADAHDRNADWAESAVRTQRARRRPMPSPCGHRSSTSSPATRPTSSPRSTAAHGPTAMPTSSRGSRCRSCPACPSAT
jgi:membrane-bound serine protease (ClpP class)